MLPPVMSPRLSHVDARGRVRMVDVTAKKVTTREAVARGPLTKRLRHLEMSFAGLPDVSNLVTAPWERLTSLALGNARLGWEIVEAPALETLVSLRLFGCECDPRVEFHVKRRWPAARIE